MAYLEGEPPCRFYQREQQLDSEPLSFSALGL